MILLDVDGTLTRPKSGGEFGQYSRDHIAIPESLIAMQAAKDAGVTSLVGITNQGGVASGHKSFEDCVAEQEFKLSLLPLLECVFFCPDYAGMECWSVRRGLGAFPLHNCRSARPWRGTFRKPGAGMLRVALGMRDQAPATSLMVGDRAEDEAAALAAGTKFLTPEQWWNYAWNQD